MTPIAGPAFASFLQLSSVKANVTLLERAPRVRPEGQNIDLRGVGLDSARLLGLEQSIRAHLTGEAGVQWVDDGDRAIASIPASEPGEAQGPTADIEMLRGTLARLIVKRCEELGRHSEEQGGAPIEFIYGDYIEELQQQGDLVRVKLAISKAQRTFDIVVGADGLQSRTRRQAFGLAGEDDRLHKLGIYGAFFSMPRTASDSDWRRWYHAPLARGVMLRPSDCPNRTTVFMHVKSEDQRFTDAAVHARDVAAQKALIRETFADIGWRQKERLLRELDRSNDFYYDMVAQVKMDKWSKGRVVLIGDAA
ncbi:hypothetical protein N0V83_004422 [Neocucurbitaria cava]|uniref:FAD-binding domain-containing protein n=1 Tax=Neocucurbitaria cava TaxID=798079 RepID=A0A9W9CMZ7_9PLEO|nr:hypothetical protein N0V83_004422 [Neocucurbitaria cava]